MEEFWSRRRQPEDTWGTPSDHLDPEAQSLEGLGASEELRRVIEDGLQVLREDRRRAIGFYFIGHGLKQSTKMQGWTPKRVDNQRYRDLSALRRYLAARGYNP